MIADIIKKVLLPVHFCKQGNVTRQYQYIPDRLDRVIFYIGFILGKPKMQVGALLKNHGVSKLEKEALKPLNSQKT
jgi:hypothetical protein